MEDVIWLSGLMFPCHSDDVHYSSRAAEFVAHFKGKDDVIRVSTAGAPPPMAGHCAHVCI